MSDPHGLGDYMCSDRNVPVTQVFFIPEFALAIATDTLLEF
jgi:hypothetical protein